MSTEISKPAQPAKQSGSAPTGHAVSHEGYTQALESRHVQMIAIGGAIGVGLFMGAGTRLHNTGPALILSYAFCGFIAFLLMRALGELTMYRPTSGSFVSYAGEFFGSKGAYATGWMYFLNWATTGIAELSAIGMYVHTQFAPGVPQWIPALCALCLLVGVNLISVRAFGEFEFWASLLKVLALLSFLIAGALLVGFGAKVGDGHASVSNLWANSGGFMPKGVLPVIVVMNGVIFAYASIEMLSIAAGEMKDYKREVPKAVRAVIYRIGVFYIGSITLLAMLQPADQYIPGQSPFVVVFNKMGQTWIGNTLTFVVIVAALSSCNSGIYSLARVMRTMAGNGHCPQVVTVMSKRNLPKVAIAVIAVIYLGGVVLNYVSPGNAFELALNSASIGIIFTWVMIFACQIAYRRQVTQGLKPDSGFRMPGGTRLSMLGIALLLGILVLIGFDGLHDEFKMGLYTLGLIPFLAAALWIGWRVITRRGMDRTNEVVAAQLDAANALRAPQEEDGQSSLATTS